MKDHPRIRGEHVAYVLKDGQSQGSSPHTRGAPDLDLLKAEGSGIIPAYAGSTTTDRGRTVLVEDHPRIRGEHGRSRHPGRSLPRIIPAYAGSTSSPAAHPSSRSDHPRIRGEHPGGTPDAAPTRRIIPAYAGSTALDEAWIFFRADHPRIRGEHALALLLWRGEAGSSPHTRGARGGADVDARRRRIIPAYAGSTTRAGRARPAAGDHPRIRGEHLFIHEGGRGFSGSSPHTRGAPGTQRC